MDTNEEHVIEDKNKTIGPICFSPSDSGEEALLKKIEEEFHRGLDEVKKFNPSVTFYGSARLKEDNPYYKKVQNLAYRISKELGYAVFTGGGGGVMEAANRGAFEAGGKSVGLTINIRSEQKKNKFLTNEIPFNFFFTRQTSMSYGSEVVIFCPGGFGTLSELFEILTLQQTNKIDRFPIILFGSDYWAPLEKIIKETLLEKYHMINENEYNFDVISDDEDEILEVIRITKLRDGKEALKF